MSLLMIPKTNMCAWCIPEVLVPHTYDSTFVVFDNAVHYQGPVFGC